VENCRSVVQRAHAATNSERNKQFTRSPANRLKQSRALLMGGRDIEQNYFIRSCGAVRGRQFCWISCISQLEKLRALDDTPSVHIQARDNSLRKHRILSPTRPPATGSPLSSSPQQVQALLSPVAARSSAGPPRL